MTDLLILGGRGMLGRAVAIAARARGLQVIAAGSEIDVANYDALRTIEEELQPAIVLNCAGLIPHKPFTAAGMVRVNALGPWTVCAAFRRSKIINISTDCVFDGSRSVHHSGYTIEDQPNAQDVYGRTKAMGECPSALNVRTSFIGFDHGLLKWLLDQKRGTAIEGWRNAMWSGGTVYDVALGIVGLFTASEPCGVVHLSSTPIDKWSLLSALNRDLGLGLFVAPVDDPHINRILVPTHRFTRDLSRLEEEHASKRVHSSRT